MGRFLPVGSLGEEDTPFLAEQDQVAADLEE